jgi:hypothetical protein
MTQYTKTNWHNDMDAKINWYFRGSVVKMTQLGGEVLQKRHTFSQTRRSMISPYYRINNNFKALIWHGMVGWFGRAC